MLLFNLKIALRNIWKNPVFSFVNIFGLALGIASCLVIGIYLWNELSVDRFHANISNIFRLTEKQNQADKIYQVAVTPGPLASALRQDFPDIVNSVRFGSWSGTLKNENKSIQPHDILLTDNSVFQVFDFPLVKGNPLKALLGPNEIVITEKLAALYFGADWKTNPSLLGQIFKLNNDADFKLVGIARNPPENSSIQFDVLLPLEWLLSTDKGSNQWNSNNYHTYVQVKPGTSGKLFQSKIVSQLSKYNPETTDQLLLQPLADQYLYSTFDFKTDWGKRSDIGYIKIFAGVGILLLIMACVNFINLSTARSIKRAMEVGVRKVNGASRGQLVRQFLSESLLIAVVAAVLSLGICTLIQPLLAQWIGIDIISRISFMPVFPFFLVFVFVVGIVGGIYPAYVLSAHAPSKVLTRLHQSYKGRTFRQVLVISQFVISMVLITSTFFMVRQLQFIQKKDLGFNQDQLLTVRLGGAFRGSSRAFKDELEKTTGVIAAAPATMTLANVMNSSYVEWEGMASGDQFLITQANVDPGFIPALQLKLIAGNNFSVRKANDTSNYIINESAVTRMGYTNENAVGKQLNFWGTKGVVVGVVKDFHYRPLNAAIEPFILRYQPDESYFNMFIKIAPGKTREVLAAVQSLYLKYEKDVPFDYSFLNESIAATYQSEQRTVNIIILFAGLTIFVGCLGLFGLAVFSAEQRTKEIGIRKILGAGVRSIAVLLTKDFVKLVIISIFIAVPLTVYAIGNWLQSFAYRIEQSWWVFVVCGILVTLLACVTVSVQAIRSAMANPAESLKER